MYALGQEAQIISAISMFIGIFMAHTLHKSPKSVKCCTIVYIILFAICIAIGEFLNIALPQFTEQRIGNFTGCIFVFGYIYLFQNLPLQQRIFNYFFAVNCMYMLLVISRTFTMLLVGYLGLPFRITYFICYILITMGYLIIYQKWLKNVFRKGLVFFKTNLTSLTIFSIICYFSTLFLLDVWVPWPALDLHSAMPYISLILMNLSGYYLAFRTLGVVGKNMETESDAKMAHLQLGLAEKEYRSTMGSIDQIRRMRHDMNHHLSAISALVAKDDKLGAQEYIAKTAELLPQKPLTGNNLITASFVDRYAELCREEKIKFTATVEYDETRIQNKAHLGILLGNSLQNAFDAAKMASGANRFVLIEGRHIYDNLALIVKNGYNGGVEPNLKSAKGEGHGMGISSMQNVVEGYNGYLDAAYDGTVFTLKIVLPIKQ